MSKKFKLKTSSLVKLCNTIEDSGFTLTQVRVDEFTDWIQVTVK